MALQYYNKALELIPTFHEARDNIFEIKKTAVISGRLFRPQFDENFQKFIAESTAFFIRHAERLVFFRQATNP